MVAAILNLKKCTRGVFGASSEFVWGDVHVSFLKKSAFCNFIPGSTLMLLHYHGCNAWQEMMSLLFVSAGKDIWMSEWMNEWMNEWMKSYIAYVSSRRLFRALNIESNLARPVIIQIPTQSPGRYTAELPLRRSKLILFQANSPYVPSTQTLWIFWGLAGWKLRLRPTLAQSDEPSDLRGSLSPTSVYSTWQSPGGHPSNYDGRDVA